MKQPVFGVLALDDLLEVDADATAAIIGDGELRGEVEKAVRQSRNHERIRVLGRLPREEVFSLMSQAQVLVVTSETESFGMVAIEALSVGCSVIGFPVGVLPELAESTRAVRLVSPPGAGRWHEVLPCGSREDAQRAFADFVEAAKGDLRMFYANLLDRISDPRASHTQGRRP